MAFRSDGPINVALPPFRGATRRILLAAIVFYFLLLVSELATRELAGVLHGLFALQPAMVYKLVWQVLSYPFVNDSLFGLLFAALSIWFFGSALEEELGQRWMTEFFLTCTAGGAVLACALCFALGGRVEGLELTQTGASLWPFSMALLVVFAALHADQELNFNFILRLKAKYLAAIYLLVYLAIAIGSRRRFDAVLVITNALAGWLFLRYAPRKGVRFAANDRIFGMRDAWALSKRRRAAKKFSVYMQKQGRDVQFDETGRYIDPDGKPRDPNDRKWMN